MIEPTVLSMVRKSANDEIDQIESRIQSRSSPTTYKLTRRQSIQQSLERGPINLMSKSPIIDNRCRSEAGEQLLSPIPYNGKPPILIQTKQEIQSMVNTRIRHHHKAQMLIEKAEMVQLARVGTTQQSSALLQQINQAIQPLQSRATVPQNAHNRLQFATPANLNHPMAYQTDLDPASMKNQSKRVQFRLKNIENIVVYLFIYLYLYTMVYDGKCVQGSNLCAPSKRLSFVQSSPSTPHVALRMDNKMFRSATSNLAML